jgi:hypothetical protein
MLFFKGDDNIMTDRERWTVYPLIFLTLGIALKDKLVEAVDLQCRNLVCNAVHVTDQNGRQQALFTATQSGGQLRSFGQPGAPTVIVGQAPQLSGLIFTDAQGAVLPGSVAVEWTPPEKKPATDQGARQPAANP